MRRRGRRAILLGCAALLLAAAGYVAHALVFPYDPPPMHSPDGRYVLDPWINRKASDRQRRLCVGFDILDANGNLLDRHQTGASHRMRWSISWTTSGDAVVLDSSDVGTYTWRLGPDGKWHVDSDQVNW